MTETAPALPADVRASFLQAVPDDDAADRPNQVIDVGARRVSLGNDDYATLIDPAELRDGHRKKALVAIPNDASNVAMGISMQDGVALIAITDWTLPLPIPAKDEAFLRGEGFADSLDQLTFAQADRLRVELADYQRILFRRDRPTEPGTGPTGPSAG